MEKAPAGPITNLGHLRVRMFGAEDNITGHGDETNRRQSVIASATAQYEAWMGRNNMHSIIIQDIITENHTAPAGPGWRPSVSCVITVKYFGASVP